MKKFFKILGIVLLVLVIVVAAFAVWQRKYVSALIDGLMYDEEALGQKQVEQTEKVVEDIGKHIEAQVRPLTDEEKEQIASGDLSQTALMAQIIAEATGVELPEVEAPLLPEKPSAETNAGDNKKPDVSKENTNGQSRPSDAPAPTPSKPTSDQLIGTCVGKLYSLQSQYTGQLAAFFSRAQTSYWKIRRESGEAAARSSIMSSYAGEVAAMESACDAKVEALLSQLSADLKAIGADTSVVGTLRAAYNSEKASQRAAYVNRYLK